MKYNLQRLAAAIGVALFVIFVWYFISPDLMRDLTYRLTRVAFLVTVCVGGFVTWTTYPERRQ